MDTKNWLNKINSTLELREIVLPGSHDAGVYGDSVETVGIGGWNADQARTQDNKIYKQAADGSRVFDVRVFLKQVKVNGKKVIEPTMGHFAMEKFKWPGLGKTTGAIGGYGGSLMHAMTNARHFVENHPSEFLILRISHTYCPDEVSKALDLYMAKPHGSGGTKKQFFYTDTGNIATTPISKLRGKIIMVFANEFHKRFDPTKGYHPFYKYSGTPNANGLCFCGIYKSKKDMKEVLANAVTAADEHAQHTQDHLHWVYWQQTGGNVEMNTKGKDGAHARLDAYLDEIKKKKTNGWKLPNVIGHDFVSATTCSKIIELNGIKL